MPAAPSASNKETQDTWFDPVDYVEMDETWFDIPEHNADETWHDIIDHDKDNRYSQHIYREAAKSADDKVPVSDDLRRSMKQLIRTLGGCGEAKMFSLCLSQILPGHLGHLAPIGHSLYTAVTTGQNYEALALHGLGLASQSLPPDINFISHLATYIRDTVTNWVGDTFLEQFLGDGENNSATNVFTALAITAMLAKWWMTDEKAPQRPFLRVPNFTANLFIRVNHCWKALGSMVQRPLPPDAETVIATPPFPSKSQFTAIPASSSAAGRSGGDALLPLVAAAVAVPVATSYMQALKSKGTVAAGIAAGLTACTVAGKMMWNMFYSEVNGNISARNAMNNSGPGFTGGNETAGNSTSPYFSYLSLIRPYFADKALNQSTSDTESRRTLEESVGNNFPPYNDNADNTTRLGSYRYKTGASEQSDAVRNETIMSDPVTKAFGSPKSSKRLVRMLLEADFLDRSRPSQSFTKIDVAAALGHILYKPDHRFDDFSGYKKNIFTVARYILQAERLYGGKPGEDLTAKQAESVIHRWLFDNVLGMSPVRYLAGKVTDDRHTQTASELSAMLNAAPESAELAPLSGRQKWFFQKLWNDALDKTLPFRHWPATDPVQSLKVTDDTFVWTHSGALFLVDAGVDLSSIPPKNCSVFGKALWEMAESGNITVSNLKYLELPAVLFQPGKCLDNTDYECRLNTVNEYVEHRRIAAAAFNDLTIKFGNLKKATQAWASMDEMADRHLDNNCWPDDIMNLPNIRPEKFYGTPILSPEQSPAEQLAYGRILAKKMYINGEVPPGCPDINLEEEFRAATDQLASKFMDVDEYFLAIATGELEKSELDFINAENCTIRQVTTTLTGINTPRIHPELTRYIKINQENTDLYSFIVGDQQRIYAYIPQKQSGYKLQRLNNVENFILNNIFGFRYNNMMAIGPSNKVKLTVETRGPFDEIVEKQWVPLQQNFDATQPAITGNGTSVENLIQHVKKKHRQEFYDQMYRAGYDPTDIEKEWNFAKHFIPFYDCATEKFPDNLGSCILDALMVIPVVGEAAGLTGKFSMSLVRGARAGMSIAMEDVLATRAIVTQAVKEISLPTFAEMASLGKNTLRTLDPGFELLHDTGKLSYKGLNKLVDWVRKGKNVNDIRVMEEVLKKIPAEEDFKAIPPLPSASYEMAYLPHSKTKVPVTAVEEMDGRKVYVMANPETSEKSGKKYLINSEGELRTHINNENTKKSDIGANLCEGGRFKRGLDEMCRPPRLPFKKNRNNDHIYNVNIHNAVSGKLSKNEFTRLSALEKYNLNRHTIIKNSFKNGIKISESAVNKLSKMSDDKLVDFVRENLRVKITRNNAGILRNNIKELNSALKIINNEMDSRVWINLDSAANRDAAALYATGNGFIIINENIFEYPASLLTSAILHECSHATETLDYLYMPHMDHIIDINTIMKYRTIETNKEMKKYYNTKLDHIQKNGLDIVIAPPMKNLRVTLSEKQMNNYIGKHIVIKDESFPSDLERGFINSADTVSQTTILLSGVTQKHLIKKDRLNLEDISLLMKDPDSTRNLRVDETRSNVIG